MLTQALMVRTCLLIAFLALGSPLNAGADSDREDCSVCGMWIDLYMKTRHVVTLVDGASESFCSITCAAKYVREHKDSVRMIQAADFETKELLEAQKAFYLEGSDIPGVMSNTSRIAFSSRERADRFRRTHGGRILSFQDALKSIGRE